jgi:hypothetical protein
VESLSAVSVHAFSKRGRCYGLLLRIQRQAYVLGATERGIFYRFGAKLTETKPGKWNTLFGIKTRIGIAELMIKIGMKDDVVPVKFRPARVRGSLHFSRTGCISFIGGSLAPASASEANQQYLPAIDQINEGDDINSY